ncbi:hypothetical protein LOK49_LG15G02304 [Camellia lanceoleosa]|uniref:Uncharacterized protein n=1 Tax=Camellia lanceoleosa TaxID=1840588 RepID=A0ACC0F256_9ERIC|nr:hypothetical protein LOK49_LG15G02304 [Camellia lanceoleosa]
MSFSPEKQNPVPPLKKTQTPSSWSDLWLNNNKSLNNVVFAMKLHSLSKPKPQPHKTLFFDRSMLLSDPISLLSDQLLLQILSKLP